MTIEVGMLVTHPVLGLCRAGLALGGGERDVTPLWQKGDTLVDEDNEPVAVVAVDESEMSDEELEALDENATRVGLTTLKTFANGTRLRNVTLEIRVSQHTHTHTQSKLAELGL